MPYQVYKVLHLAGLIMLFLAWGAILLGSARPSSQAKFSPRLVMFTHGLALLLLLVAGFGLLARLGIHWPWPGWIWSKVAIWLLLGGGVAIARRRPKLNALLWWLIPLLGVAASFFAVYKPY